VAKCCALFKVTAALSTESPLRQMDVVWSRRRRIRTLRVWDLEDGKE
jgi:hypothetical protein